MCHGDARLGKSYGGATLVISRRVMADAAARREARRRKILENSENRLRRIAGNANPDKTENDKKDEANDKPNSSDCSENGILERESLAEKRAVDPPIRAVEADMNFGGVTDIDRLGSPSRSFYSTESDLFSLPSTSNVPHRRNADRRNGFVDNGNPLNLNNPDSPKSPGKDDFSFGNPPQETTEPTLLDTILSTRLAYVFLAIIVNVAVILKLEHLFGSSIIVPFFVVMLGRLCLWKNDDPAKGSNLLVAALILSNCRPDFVRLIHRVKDASWIFGKILRDLAVYIFTFVILYTVLGRYRDEPVDILSHDMKSEAISSGEFST